jgi:hypothetical protein
MFDLKEFWLTCLKAGVFDNAAFNKRYEDENENENEL